VPNHPLTSLIVYCTTYSSEGDYGLKYCVVDRGDEVSRGLALQFHKLVAKYNMVLDEQQPELVLSIGGDGTFLKAFHQFEPELGESVAYVGIHTGRLGFFADWKPDEIEQLAELMHIAAANNELRTVQYPLVEIQITTESGVETHLAVNEFTLKGIEGTFIAQLNINDEMFEMFRGDGICISTPSGSTAYNKSLGGALIHPSVESMQIAEMASLNNRVYRTLGSSMVLPKHHHCDIYPQTDKPLLLSLDHLNVQRDDLISIRCRVADQKIHFSRFRPFPFWSRVREAFIGYDLN
jgi:NAD+ kinase